MKPSMNPSFSRFRQEVRHFHRLAVLNIVFAALAIAYGISAFIMAVFGLNAGISSSELRLLSGALAMVLSGLGLSWLLSTTRVFEGVAAIKGDLNSLKDPGNEERVICLIVRMLSHYRENRATIQRMILVCITGGSVVFLLGIINSLEVLKINGTGGEFILDAVRLIPPMLVSLGIAIASLLSSHYFSRVSMKWDHHLREIDESECTLKQSLGLD
jgi:hypothetical protein